MKLILNINTDFTKLHVNEEAADDNHLTKENKKQKKREIKKMENRSFEDNRKWYSQAPERTALNFKKAPDAQKVKSDNKRGDAIFSQLEKDTFKSRKMR